MADMPRRPSLNKPKRGIITLVAVEGKTGLASTGFPKTLEKAPARRAPVAGVSQPISTERSERADNCADCTECEKKCPQEVPVQKWLSRIKQEFGS
jgi:succinate dehydrogenase/fumarate reductase-like Fe-S protein